MTERVKVALTNTRECTGEHWPKPCLHTSLDCSQKCRLNLDFVSSVLKQFPTADYALAIRNATDRFINVAADRYSIFTGRQTLLCKKKYSEDYYYYPDKAIATFMLRHQPTCWVNQKVLINFFNLPQKLSQCPLLCDFFSLTSCLYKTRILSSIFLHYLHN